MAKTSENTIVLTNDEDCLDNLLGALSFYYLAHPFSNPDPEIQRTNLEHARFIYGVLFSQHVLTYNPLEAMYETARWFNWPSSFEPYKKLNETFIDVAEGVIVVCCDGWENSKGVAAEIAFAELIGLPVWYLDVTEFMLERGFGQPATMPGTNNG